MSAMNQVIFPLMGVALGIYVAVLSILYARQGCAYLRSSKWNTEWEIDQESNPIGFWIVIALMLAGSVAACCSSLMKLFAVLTSEA